MTHRYTLLASTTIACTLFATNFLQRQADLSKTISQQWHSLSAEEHKYWDDLAKQRKREHEEMYTWYVYQPTRTVKEKKGKAESTADGKVRKEKDGKKERRDHTKSSSRVRGSGARARNSSSCSTTSTTSTTSVISSASTADSEGFSELDSLSTDGSLYGQYGYANGGCSSVREVEMADLADFDMSESEGSQGQGQGASLAIDTPLSKSGPLSTSSYSHSHHGGHGHGHGHLLSVQIPTQTAQSLVPGPLSFVPPQNHCSTSAPGAPTPPTMPADLYLPVPPTIKIPRLLETAPGSNGSSAVGSSATHEGSEGEQQMQMNGHGQQRQGEFGGMNGFQFPNSHLQSMSYGMPG